MADVHARPALAALALLAVLVAAAVWWSHLSPAVRPPPVVSDTAPASQFSAQRARLHLEAIADRPRPIGSLAHAQVQAYLLDALRGLGLEPQLHRATVMHGTGATLTVARVANIVARLPGTGSPASSSSDEGGRQPRPAVVLMAHYDSVPHSPGANDAGNGVVAILETVRALRAGPALHNDVIVLITDAEEVGLLGARAWVEGHPWAADTGVVLNAEGRGNTGPVYMFRTVGGNGGMVRTLARAVPGAQADSLSNDIFRLMPNDTDLSVFRDAGHLGMDFANIRGLSHYHTALDNLNQANPRTLQHHGDQLLALARAFADQELSTLAAADRIYFAAPGLGLVHYPLTWALPLALGATVLMAGLLLRLHRRGQWRLRGASLGLVHLLAALLGLPLLVALAWAAVAPWLPELAGFRHGAPYHGHRYLIAMVLLAMAVHALSLVWLRRHLQPAEMLLAPLLLWSLAALASAIWLPGASWVFLWPWLFALAGLAVLWLDQDRRPVAVAAGLALSAVPVIALLAPMIAGLEEAMGMAAAAAIIGLLVLALSLLLLPLVFILRHRLLAALVPGVLLLTAAGVLALALAGAGFDHQRRQADTLEYVADVSRGQAYWASVDAMPGPWTGSHLGQTPRRAPLPDWAPSLPASSGDPWLYPAPVLREDAPDAELVAESSTTSGLRHLRLRITSPAHSHATVIGFPADLPVTGLRIDGQPAPEGIASQGLEIVWYGALAQGAKLDFTVPVGAPVQLQLRTNIPGLPAAADGQSRPRPEDTMAAGPWTERTRLLRTVTF